MVIQVKNGPIDFQVREPVSPLFSGLEKTNTAMELQVTQEYMGQARHLVFLAPQTSGDFKTLVNAVRARPGVFVRTSQDLNQATLDRSRLESYLMAIRALKLGTPAASDKPAADE